MNPNSRRQFFQTAGAAAAASLLAKTGRSFAGDACCAKPSCKAGFQLGLASYTTRELSLDQTIQIARRMGLKYICLNPIHLPLNSSKEKILETAKTIRDAGLDYYGGGVIDLLTPEEIENGFQYAQTAGLTIIVACTTPQRFPAIEKKIRETGIAVAIHNHGPEEKNFPTPLQGYELLRGMDPRFGYCHEIGQTVRYGVDPVEVILKCKDRILDLHFKDEDKNTAQGRPLEVGRGVIDIPAVLAAMKEIGYGKIASLEYEKDGEDPLPGIAESIGYIRGCLAAQQQKS